MLETDNFNTLINHITFTIDYLLKDKKYPAELCEYLYLITAGMIINYGDESIDDIYNMIEDVKFIIFDKTNLNYSNINDFLYVNPTKHNYLDKKIDVSSNFPTIKFSYELLYNEVESSNIKTLEYLSHELNYILFNKKKKIKFTHSIKLRYNYLRNNIEYDDNEISTFNKVFNVLQAEDIVKTILKLRDYNIKNIRFEKALEKLKCINFNTYKFEGKDLLVNLFRPLYEVPKLKVLINKNNFLNEDAIAKEFDDVLGNDSYRETCKKLDSLDYMISTESKYKDNYYYDLSIEYLSIRNEFVNKYLIKTCLSEN